MRHHSDRSYIQLAQRMMIIILNTSIETCVVHNYINNEKYKNENEHL